MPDKKPKPPPANAPKADHEKYAKVVLEDPEYKVKPKDYQDTNDEAKP